MTNPAAVEGRIRLTLTVYDGRVERVRIDSSRNLQACGVLRGKPVDEVAVLVPLLFSVCGRAQWAAALAACEQAEGRTASPSELLRRRLLVLAEAAREHSRRILLDWPVLCGEPPALESMMRVQNELRAIESTMGTVASASACGAAIESFERALSDVLLDGVQQVIHDFKQLAAWCQRGSNPAAGMILRVIKQGMERLGRSDVRTLPEFDRTVLEQTLAADRDGSYVARPGYNGTACETGPLARLRNHPLGCDLSRRFSNGLLTRMALQMTELLEVPPRLRALVAMMGDGGSTGSVDAAGAGCGLGVVEAARGRLVHRVELEDGHVRRYQILAPTEWNFHPQGPLAAGLSGLAVRDEAELRRQAALLVTALDPCVSYDVVVQ